MVFSYKIALKISLIYFVFSFLYILLSDSVLLSFVDDPYTLTIFQTYKGLAFVLLTSILLFFIVNREIYKQKQSEHKLRIAKEKAERSDRLKTSFLNNLSHEIRSPMNCILGFSELLTGNDISEEELNSYAGTINDSGNQLLKVIDDVLDISKIEVGIVDINEIEFSLSDLLDEIDTYTKDIILKKDNKISFKISNEASETVDIIKGDKSRLVQILQNLIANAVNFTSEGSVEVLCFKKSDEFLLFHVKDTGVGIEENKVGLIFEPFIKEENSIVRKYNGTGLGLPISKAFVEMLGGEIGVNSSKGIGSDFFFTIPIS